MQNKFIKTILLIIIILFVGWLCIFIGIDLSIKTLILIMSIDYILGLSLALGGMSKHGDGKLSSKIGYKGIVKKITMLLLVGTATIVDTFLNSSGITTSEIKNIAITAFIFNEIISIVENAKIGGGLDVVKIISKFKDNIDSIKKINKK